MMRGVQAVILHPLFRLILVVLALAILMWVAPPEPILL